MMTIVKRAIAGKPPVSGGEKAADAFIDGAPDGVKKVGGLTAGRRRQITHALPQEKLDALDELAKSTGVSRAALINIGIDQVLRRGASIGGKD